jgi:hypothetical protein
MLDGQQLGLVRSRAAFGFGFGYTAASRDSFGYCQGWQGLALPACEAVAK